MGRATEYFDYITSEKEPKYKTKYTHLTVTSEIVFQRQCYQESVLADNRKREETRGPGFRSRIRRE